MESEVLTIKDVLNILKNRLSLIVIIILLGTSCGIFFQTKLIKPTYLTTTKLFIGKEVNDENGTVYDSSDVSLYQNLMETYAGIVSSQDLIERAMEKSKCDLPASYVYNSLMVESGEKNQFLTLSIITANPEEGVPILEAITDEFISTSKELISNSVVKVISTPREPSGPYNYSSNQMILYSFAGSAFFSICLAIFLEFLDNTVKKKEDIDKILGVPILGVVPVYNNDGKGKGNKKRRENSREKRVVINDFYSN